MSVENGIITVGFDKNGDAEFGVRCAVLTLTLEQMNELRTMIPVAIGTMEQMWRDEQMKKPENRAFNEDICGFCGKPGADKIPHPVRWPNEDSAGTEHVHAACEDVECRRAHSLLSDKERENFLRGIECR